MYRVRDIGNWKRKDNLLYWKLSSVFNSLIFLLQNWQSWKWKSFPPGGPLHPFGLHQTQQLSTSRISLRENVRQIFSQFSTQRIRGILVWLSIWTMTIVSSSSCNILLPIWKTFYWIAKMICSSNCAFKSLGLLYWPVSSIQNLWIAENTGARLLGSPQSILKMDF